MIKRLSIHLAILLLAGLFLSACGPGPTATGLPAVSSGAANARPVLIDTDMASDDVMAILYLLSRPDISVQAITISGTGETHCEPGVRNALGLVALAGKDGIPVACGREKPLVGDTEFPSAWRRGVEKIRGVTLPKGDEPSPLSAVELIAQVVQSSSEKVALLTLGPLTNLGEALQARPEIAQNIGMVYITAAVLTDESLASIETRQIRVVEEGAQTGRTVAGKEGPTVRVAVSADAQRFEELFLQSLNGK